MRNKAATVVQLVALRNAVSHIWCDYLFTYVSRSHTIQQHKCTRGWTNRRYRAQVLLEYGESVSLQQYAELGAFSGTAQGIIIALYCTITIWCPESIRMNVFLFFLAFCLQFPSRIPKK